MGRGSARQVGKSRERGTSQWRVVAAEQQVVGSFDVVDWVPSFWWLHQDAG